MERFCQVAVNFPKLGASMTYKFDSELVSLKRGDVVEVPFGNRKTKGCILGLEQSDFVPKLDLKKIKSVEPPVEYSLSEHQLQLFEWMSKYYHYPLGQLVKDILPKVLSRPRELKFYQGVGKEEITLNSYQTKVARPIEEALFSGFSRWLIHGITGSGKSFVYLHLIKKLVAQGKSVLFLLPEINLSPQFIAFFQHYLNIPIYAYNSAISNSDKYGLWKLLPGDQQPKLILGVRSSVFLPIENLGAIFVDEEHDSSFKQEDRCTYNARDVATKRAALLKIPVVLGSATPSMESYFGLKNTPNYLTMTERAGKGELPEIVYVDERDKQGNQDIWPFQQKTLDAIQAALDKKEQVIVFVNRLGFATYFQCTACGSGFDCPNCTSPLKYFKSRKILQCAFCDYRIPPPEECAECGCLSFTGKGFGTEKVAHILSDYFHNYKVSRFDRDEISTTKQLEQRLEEFHSEKVHIMVGTQMLSKGHNFKKVNLVVVLGLDAQLNFPDFRSGERVYQLLTQVAGRSGRFGESSQVWVQTLNPDRELFDLVAKHSFDGFYQSESEQRKLCHLPPYTKVATLTVSSRFYERLTKYSALIDQVAQGLLNKGFNQLHFLGPRPAGIEKKKNNYSWIYLIRTKELNQLHNFLNSLRENLEEWPNTRLKIDIDPIQLP